MARHLENKDENAHIFAYTTRQTLECTFDLLSKKSFHNIGCKGAQTLIGRAHLLRSLQFSVYCHFRLFCSFFFFLIRSYTRARFSLSKLSSVLDFSKKHNFFNWKKACFSNKKQRCLAIKAS